MFRVTHQRLVCNLQKNEPTSGLHQKPLLKINRVHIGPCTFLSFNPLFEPFTNVSDVLVLMCSLLLRRAASEYVRHADTNFTSGPALHRY